MAKAVCIGVSSIRHAYAIAILQGEHIYSCVHDLVIFQDDTSLRYTLLLDFRLMHPPHLINSDEAKQTTFTFLKPSPDGTLTMRLRTCRPAVEQRQGIGSASVQGCFAGEICI